MRWWRARVFAYDGAGDREVGATHLVRVRVRVSVRIREVGP